MWNCTQCVKLAIVITQEIVGKDLMGSLKLKWWNERRGISQSCFPRPKPKRDAEHSTRIFKLFLSLSSAMASIIKQYENLPDFY